MIEPKTFAANTLQLLQQDPRRYRCFGVYWWFVKAILKKFYTQENLHLLGDFQPGEPLEHVPLAAQDSLQSMLEAAVEEYRDNATFNLCRTVVEAPDGELVTMEDPDAGL